MITQAYLNREIALARKIYLFYVDKMLSYMFVNSNKYDQWYRDALQIGFLLGVIEAFELTDGVVRLGFDDKTDNTALLAFYKIREYYLDEIDSDYITPSLSNITTPGGPTYQPFNVDWKEVIITVSANGTTVIPLPFTVANVDFETIIVSIEGGMNPIGIITDPETEEGFYIENNTLYWNGYYDLNLGDKIHIKYKQLRGVI
jgi:hypothetical protein